MVDSDDDILWLVIPYCLILIVVFVWGVIGR